MTFFILISNGNEIIGGYLTVLGNKINHCASIRKKCWRRENGTRKTKDNLYSFHLEIYNIHTYQMYVIGLFNSNRMLNVMYFAFIKMTNNFKGTYNL